MLRGLSALVKLGGRRPFKSFAEGYIPGRSVSGGRPFKTLAEGRIPGPTVSRAEGHLP